MPLNTLLLPLLGGYVLVSQWNRTKFRAKRHRGHRLFFESAIAGALLLVAGLVISGRLAAWSPGLRALWKDLAPFAYSGTSTIAFLLGCVLWWPLNWLFPKEQEISRVIREDDDYLEGLLERALDELRMVSLTTSQGKVYIGHVTGNFVPSYERKYIKILPYVSGYRTEETREMVITTKYSPVYEQLAEDDEEFANLNQNDFEVVIPVAEVHSISIFDPDAYRLFNRASDTGGDE